MGKYREGFREASVNVRNVHLLQAAFVGLDFQAGGLSEDTCIGHLTVIDIPNERAFMVPMNRTGINSMIGLMEKVLNEAEEEHVQDAEES